MRDHLPEYDAVGVHVDGGTVRRRKSPPLSERHDFGCHPQQRSRIGRHRGCAPRCILKRVRHERRILRQGEYISIREFQRTARADSASVTRAKTWKSRS